MKLWQSPLSAIAVAGALTLPTCTGREVYVSSSTGNDNGPGTYARPWQSLAVLRKEVWNPGAFVPRGVVRWSESERGARPERPNCDVVDRCVEGSTSGVK
jgi:hypothetical protein